jgi:4-hydroxybenzoate polyprenyltransferase
MIPGLIALTVFNALVAYFFLPEKMLKAGLILGLGVVVYFVIIHLLKRHLQWGKELFVSVVVCVGMVVLPGLSGDFSFDLASITIVLCMVFINFTNLILFSYFDYDADMENGLQSAATAWGKERTKSLALHTMATAFFLYLIWTFMVVSPVKLTTSVIFLLMFNVLLIMYVQEERFAQDERYRFWGDFIFLIPGLVWYFLINKPFF